MEEMIALLAQGNCTLRDHVPEQLDTDDVA